MELYKDNESAANATKEVESIRRNADYLGAAITLGAFAGNEVARLTLRARKCPDLRLKCFSNNSCVCSSLQVETSKLHLLACRPHALLQKGKRVPDPRAHRQSLGYPREPLEARPRRHLQVKRTLLGP